MTAKNAITIFHQPSINVLGQFSFNFFFPGRDALWNHVLGCVLVLVSFVQINELLFVPSTQKSDLEEGEGSTPRCNNLNAGGGPKFKFFKVL